MKRALCWWLGMAGAAVVAVAAAAPGAFAAVNPPVVTGVAVSHVTGRGATLEATITPEGSKTKYEFLLEYEVVTKKKTKHELKSAASGKVKATDGATPVSAIPHFKLKEHFKYTLIVAARNVGGETVSEPPVEFETT